ncbi:MAG: hypothetical protein P4M07_09395 [Xanthobacteraceae bacterium]|nr:hypothetical protein [Xanthobacteraceae bacterium]
MLRFRILASAVPLMVAGVLAGRQVVADVHPCISTAEAAVELADLPWQASRLVGFTADPARATVRVQIVDDPAVADFAVVDDGVSRESDSCTGLGPTRFIGIGDAAATAPTVIYLSRDDNADYRIYVRSRSFTMREAAALIVGAHTERSQTAAGAL